MFPLLGEWNEKNEESFTKYTDKSIICKTNDDQKVFWKNVKSSQKEYGDKIDKAFNQLIEEKLVIPKTILSSDLFYPWKWKFN